ncbi:MAG: alpha/beta hydrolase [Bacteroidetes bacterium]|nr:alpha/beta hydrolase [Bacteroidota bacterium]
MMQEHQLKNTAHLNAFAVNWPVEQPGAVLALVHGQSEHAGRYQHLAAWFNARQIAVAAFDQQGHGKTEGTRGHANSLDGMIDDVGLFLDKVHTWYPGVPVFLYGHSMGGNIALNYFLRRPNRLNGIIATGPWIRLAFEAPALKVAAGYLLKRILPSLTLPNGLHARLISRDPDVVQRYKNDPLVHGRISAAAGIALLEGATWLNQYSGPTPAPMLLMHGGGDKITSMPATREFAGRVTGDVTFQEWPGLYHEIHNEKEQEQVFEAELGWMLARV